MGQFLLSVVAPFAFGAAGGFVGRRLGWPLWLSVGFGLAATVAWGVAFFP